MAQAVIWDAKCHWEVLESDPYIELYGPTNVALDQSFELKAEVYAGYWEDLTVTNVTLTFENGTFIDSFDVNDTLPADTTKIYPFDIVGISLAGELSFSGPTGYQIGVLKEPSPLPK